VFAFLHKLLSHLLWFAKHLFSCLQLVGNFGIGAIAQRLGNLFFSGDCPKILIATNKRKQNVKRFFIHDFSAL
jgi:hypothetical protein